MKISVDQLRILRNAVGAERDSAVEERRKLGTDNPGKWNDFLHARAERIDRKRDELDVLAAELQKEDGQITW